jgi:hypothetical protein
MINSKSKDLTPFGNAELTGAPMFGASVLNDLLYGGFMTSREFDVYFNIFTFYSNRSHNNYPHQLGYDVF